MIRDTNAGSDFARQLETRCHAVFNWAVVKGFETRCADCGGCGQRHLSGEPGLCPGFPTVACPKCNGTGSGYRNFGEQVALVHSELSELLEYHRKGQADEPDEKCPEFTRAEIEAADAVIRLMCMSGSYGWRLGRAIEAKMAYNETRAFRHGKAY